MNCELTRTSVHKTDIAKLYGNRQANRMNLSQNLKQKKIAAMDKSKPRPYLDIAERLKWHREKVVNMTQSDYADAIGAKRSALSLWEAGTQRLSLDGALSIRKKYDLSLDFLYEGIDAALPMTLRNAWRERP